MYCVYACRHNAGNNTVALAKLIYIGESENVRDRIADHEKWREWLRHLGQGQELCFSYAPITADRGRAEAALIFHHKPPVNTEYVNEFPYPETNLHIGTQRAARSRLHCLSNGGQGRDFAV